MTPESFVYWLQGFVELSESDAVPNEKQWLVIKDHLKLVFDKKTPDRNELAKQWDSWFKKSDNPVDLIGKSVDPSYWQTPPVITC